MTEQLNFDGVDWTLVENSILKWSTAWLTCATIPDEAVTVSAQSIDFGDISKANALGWERNLWTGPSSAGGQEVAYGYITAVPGETSYTDINLGSIPASCDFLRIKMTLTRTMSPTAPTPSNMLTGAIDPIPPMGKTFMAHDSFVPLEQSFPIARAIEFINDSGTLLLRRLQSISKDNLPDDTYGGWLGGNSNSAFVVTTTFTPLPPNNTPITVYVTGAVGFSYGSAKGEPIYYLGSVTGPQDTAALTTKYARGGANQMSLSDPTDFRSVYSMDAVIEPGYFKTDPVLGTPTQKSALRCAYLYGTITTAASSTTYSGVSIGNPASSRRVLVMIGSARNINSASPAAIAPTAVTIGGVSATKLASADPDVWNAASIWMASVPSGTTADIVITWPASDHWLSSVLVYSLYNLSSGTPHNTGSVAVDGNESSNPSFNLTTAAGGFAFAVGVHVDGVVSGSNGGYENLLSGIANPGVHFIQLTTAEFYSSPFCFEMGMQGTTGSTLTITEAGLTGRAIALAAVSLS